MSSNLQLESHRRRKQQQQQQQQQQQLSSDMERTENRALLQQREVEAAKEGSLGDKQQNDGLKKPKEGSRHHFKVNHTVPHPFLLATEKRMSRERRVSLDFNEPKQKLLKSVSFNSTSSTKRSAAARVSSTKLAGKVPMKKHQGETFSTFKALPLPSFYHKNDSPSKLASNKVPVTKQKLLPDPIKSAKSDKDKPKKVPTSRTISNSAKETIVKMLKSTQKVLNPSKPTVNTIAATA